MLNCELEDYNGNIYKKKLKFSGELLFRTKTKAIWFSNKLGELLDEIDDKVMI